MRATEHLIVIFLLKCVVVNAVFPNTFEYKSRKILNVEDTPLDGKKVDDVLHAKQEQGLKIPNKTIDHPTIQTETPPEAEKVETKDKSTTDSQKVDLGIIRGHGMNSGALLRGFIVFVGLSMVVMLYIVCRSFKLNKKSNSPRMVRKYGIKANRSDMEMRPLPLDEDDEEDTIVFDKLSNQ